MVGDGWPKGNTYRRGIPHTEETKRKISEANTGRHHSEETKQKISEANKGQVQEHKQTYWQGRHLSEEHKQKISEANKGRHHSEETKQKISNANKGRRFSDEHRKNLSKARKGCAPSSTSFKPGDPRLCGKNNSSWKGGVTTEVHLIRNSSEMHTWRKAVFARDNYTCQGCGDSKGGNLIGHHILLFSTHPEARLLVANGQTLCKKCHIKLHKGVE